MQPLGCLLVRVAVAVALFGGMAMHVCVDTNMCWYVLCAVYTCMYVRMYAYVYIG